MNKEIPCLFEHIYILNKSINENNIWKNDFADQLKDMLRNIIRVCQYGFDEMVNNVLEHSAAKEMGIILTLTEHALQFKIIDNGI